MAEAVVPAQGQPGEPPEHALMRFMGRLMTGYESMASKLIEQAEISNGRVATMEKALARQSEMHMRMTEQYEELLSLRHERELQSAAAKRDAELKHAIVTDIRTLAPIVVKKLAGIPVADENSFRTLLDTFTPDQFESAISGRPLVLTDGQRELLAAMLDSIAKREEKEVA
jgi:hypothetical protein